MADESADQSSESSTIRFTAQLGPDFARTRKHLKSLNSFLSRRTLFRYIETLLVILLLVGFGLYAQGALGVAALVVALSLAFLTLVLGIAGYLFSGLGAMRKNFPDGTYVSIFKPDQIELHTPTGAIYDVPFSEFTSVRVRFGFVFLASTPRGPSLEFPLSLFPGWMVPQVSRRLGQVSTGPGAPFESC